MKLELFVENRMANDGAEHLIKVGDFDSYLQVARAAYVHMNGPPDDEASVVECLDDSARRIREATGADNGIFRGVSESGAPFTFFLETV